MTRVEEIRQAAIDFADKAVKMPKDYAIAAIADYDHGCVEGFVAGALWADVFPAACRQVLEQRRKILREHVIPIATIDKSHAYYEGKLDGYGQAIDLLGSTLESVSIELEHLQQ